MEPKLNERICLIGRNPSFLGSLGNALRKAGQLRDCLLHRFVGAFEAHTISCIFYTDYKDAHDRIVKEPRSLVIIEVKYRDDIRTIDEIRLSEDNDIAALPVIVMSFLPLRKFRGTILEEYTCNYSIQMPFTLQEFTCALSSVMAYDPDEIPYIRRAYYSLSGLVDRTWHGVASQNCREKLAEIKELTGKFPCGAQYDEELDIIATLVTRNLTQEVIDGEISPMIRDLIEQIARDEEGSGEAQ